MLNRLAVRARTRPLRHAAQCATIACALVTFAACAGSTLGSGVGDRYLDEPPYYAGERLAADVPVAHLPVGYQAGAMNPPTFDPSGETGTPVAALLAEMNAYLDSLDLAVGAVAAAAPGRAPDVRFGCMTDAIDECEEPDDLSRARLHLAVHRPSADWITWAQQTLQASDATHLLLITLETSQYWARQRDLLGRKEVRLGTGYTVSVPWLTSLDDPVSVLQLTGAVIGADGRAVRIGAEGLLANPTNLLLSAVGAQDLISEEDVERVRTAVREDLPGRPLVWQVALRNLVEGLLR